jgi:hypothetical protein
MARSKFAAASSLLACSLLLCMASSAQVREFFRGGVSFFLSLFVIFFAFDANSPLHWGITKCVGSRGSSVFSRPRSRENLSKLIWARTLRRKALGEVLLDGGHGRKLNRVEMLAATDTRGGSHDEFFSREAVGRPTPISSSLLSAPLSFFFVRALACLLYKKNTALVPLASCAP